MDDDNSILKIAVELRKDNGKDILDFDLTPNCILDLNSDSQEAIKSMFCKLISILKDKEFLLELKIEPTYDFELMKEVATEYINDLNNEILDVRTMILNEHGNGNTINNGDK